GVIYLENDLTPNAFTPARIALLEVLASGAAISLENARLYRDLQEREARVRRLIDANIIGISIWHADGRILDANDEFLRIVGYDRADLVSGRMRWTGLTTSDDQASVLHTLKKVQARADSKGEEREYLRKERSRVPVLAGGTTFDGVTDEGVGFTIDMTELKRAEQALHESEREARLIVESIPGLIATLTPAAEVEAVNEQALAYFGRTLEELQQWGTSDSIHPDDLPRAIEVVSHSMKSGDPYEIVNRIRRFDG